jgi:SAM-dependent methyltransferase
VLDLAGVACTVLTPSSGWKARLAQILANDAVLTLAGAPDSSLVLFARMVGCRTAALESAGAIVAEPRADPATNAALACESLAGLGLRPPARPGWADRPDVSIRRLQAIWDDEGTWDPTDPSLRQEYEVELAAAVGFIEGEGGWSLDAGAGSGRGSIHFARTSRVAALDLSLASLRRLKERATALGGPVHAVVGDAARLPFRAEVFSRAFGLEVWAHLEEPRGFVSELDRVLKPSAPMAISTGNSTSLIESYQRFRTGLHELRVGKPRDALRALFGDRAYWLGLRAFARDPVRRLLRTLTDGGFEIRGWTGIGLLRTPKRYLHETLSRRPPFRGLAHLVVVGARRRGEARACASYARLARNAIASFLDAEGRLAYRGEASSKDTSVPSYSTAERYRLICLVGCESYRRGASSDDDRRLAGLAKVGAKLTPDDLGLLLWWKALAGARDLQDAVTAIDDASLIVPDLDTQALAFLVLGLSAASEAPGSEALARRFSGALRARQESSGLFYSTAQRARTSTFNYHVYGTMALAAYAQATGCKDSLRHALACARTLCRLQGPQGQWWWTYDVWRGGVADRYPVFSVHQLGMAPAALFRLGRAAREDFGPWIRRGAAWAAGRNELRESLIHADEGVIWRSIRRRGAARPWCASLLKRTAWYGQGWVAGCLLPGKEINREHRPYEYGWLLAAIAEAGGDESWLP